MGLIGIARKEKPPTAAQSAAVPAEPGEQPHFGYGLPVVLPELARQDFHIVAQSQQCVGNAVFPFDSGFIKINATLCTVEEDIPSPVAVRPVVHPAEVQRLLLAIRPPQSDGRGTAFQMILRQKEMSAFFVCCKLRPKIRCEKIVAFLCFIGDL